MLNMENLLEARIEEAVELRRSMGLPSTDTTAFRLINSEGDRCNLSFILSLEYKMFYPLLYTLELLSLHAAVGAAGTLCYLETMSGFL